MKHGIVGLTNCQTKPFARHVVRRHSRHVSPHHTTSWLAFVGSWDVQHQGPRPTQTHNRYFMRKKRDSVGLSTLDEVGIKKCFFFFLVLIISVKLPTIRKVHRIIAVQKLYTLTHGDTVAFMCSPEVLPLTRRPLHLLPHRPVRRHHS